MASVSTILLRPLSILDREQKKNLTAKEFKDYIKENKIGKTRILLRLVDRIQNPRLNTSEKIDLRISSQYSILPNHWNYDEKKVDKVTLGEKDNVKINQYLRETAEEIKYIYLTEFKKKGLKPSVQDIKNILYPPIVEVIEELTFWDYWKQYNDEKKHHLSKNTLKGYKTAENLLKEYEKETDNLLDVNNSNKVYRLKFRIFLIEKGYINETITSIEKQVRTFFKWCIENEYAQNNYQSLPPLKKSQKPKVVLTKKDILKLKNTTFEKPHLETAKQLLLFSCLTGLRYSDYSDIKKEQIKEGKLIKVIQKTNERIELPLTDYASDLLKSLFLNESRKVSNQNLNKAIKEVCKTLWKDEEEIWIRYKGSDAIENKAYKYNVVETHTGRRSYATNLMIEGLPPTTVMKFTGHKSFETFKDYVNIPKEVMNEQVKESLKL